MTMFWVAGGLFVLAALLFLLPPLFQTGGTVTDSNLPTACNLPDSSWTNATHSLVMAGHSVFATDHTNS